MSLTRLSRLFRGLPLLLVLIPDLVVAEELVIATSEYTPEFIALVDQGILHAEPTYGLEPERQNLMKLALGRIDLFICEIAACQYQIRKHLPNDPFLASIEAIDRAIAEGQSFRAGFPRSRDMPAREQRSMLLRDRFNAALREMPEDERALLRARYNQVLPD